MRFKIIDPRTDQEADWKIYSKEEWYTFDIRLGQGDFYIGEVGDLWIDDRCGNIIAVPSERFRIRFLFEEENY